MLTGNRIRLRAIERGDLHTFVRWINDPEVTAGLLIGNPMSQTHEENWYEGMLKRPMEEQPLAIELKTAQTWELIGTCSFNEISWRDRVAEVGIMVGEKQHWSKGYGTDAMRLLLRRGFAELNLNRIFLHVYANNPRAIRSYEKAGFTLEGRLRQDVYKNGQYLDVLVMGILREEWKDSEV